MLGAQAERAFPLREKPLFMHRDLLAYCPVGGAGADFGVER